MRIPRSVQLLVSIVAAITIPAFAREKKIQRADLPAAVEKTVVAQSQGAEIKGFSTEKENGQTIYEVELVVDGHSKDVSMSVEGAVVEVEEEVALHSLPSPAQRGLRSRAGKGKILKVESLTKRGTLVAFEAQVLDEGRKSEIQVGPDGKPLGHEE